VLRVYQKEYDLRRFDDLVQMIANHAVSAVVQRMDGTHDLENIVLVGGAAFLFRKAVKKHFPRHAIHEVADPLHANVRGFQLLGEQYVRERPDLFPAGAPASVAGALHEDA
jgi:plasmid segregation protein ParM